MPRRWTYKASLALGVALALIGLGVSALWGGFCSYQAYANAKCAVPLRGEIDFSRPGMFVYQINGTYSSSHGEIVGLLVSDQIRAVGEPEQLLEDLQAELRIVGKVDGREVQRCASLSRFSRGLSGPERIGGVLPVFSFPPVGRGDYLATVTVTEGVSALNGIPQELQGRYFLCGMEAWPAIISGGFGAGCVLIGGLIALALLRRVFPHQQRDQGQRAKGKGLTSYPS